MLLNTLYTVARAENLTVLSTNQQRNAARIYSSTSLIDVLMVFPYLMIIIPVQIFLAIRVVKILPTRLVKTVWLVVFILALVAAMFFWAAGTITDEILWFLDAVPAGFLEIYGSAISLGLTAFIDILISVTLGVLLHRKIAGFNKRTDSTLRRILRVTLATGTFTSAIAILAASVALTNFDENVTFYIFENPLPSLYCLSVFWTLDLRSRVRDEQRRNDLQLSLGLPTANSLPGTIEDEIRTGPPAINR